MKEKLKNFSFDSISTHSLQMLSLVLIGILQMVSICFGDCAYPEFKHTAALYTSLIAVFYVAVTIRSPLTRTARNMLLFGMAFCAWPLFMQIRDFVFLVNPEHPAVRFPNGTFLCEYLLLFSFAAAADRENRPEGLKVLGWFYVAGSAVLTLWAMPFGRGLIPQLIVDQGLWNALRFKLVWNENILALVYMLGISVCILYTCMYRSWILRAGLLILACVEFVFLTLTDCRTAILMTCCILGGTAFILISRGGVRRLLFGLLAAVLVLGASYQVSTWIFKTHTGRIMAETAQMEQEKLAEMKEEAVAQAVEEAEKAGTSTEDIQVEEPTLSFSSVDIYQNNMESHRSIGHLFNFGGRLEVWTNGLKMMMECPRNLIFGLREVNHVIPWRDTTATHSHNSWLEIFMQLGLVGLAFAVYLTYQTIKCTISLVFLKKTQVYQKFVCVMMIGILISQFFEVYIFFVRFPLNFVNGLYMLCLGYMILWDRQAEPVRKIGK